MKTLTDWEKAERDFAGVVGGKLTYGSGRFSKKGDVIWPGGRGEVKQTDKEYHTVTYNKYLRQLEVLSDSHEVVLALYFQLRGYYYWREGTNTTHPDDSWSTLRVYENNLPEYIFTPKSCWKLVNRYELQELLNED